MVVLIASEISEGSALGNFEQHKMRVSGGRDLSSRTGKPSKYSRLFLGMPRSLRLNQLFMSSTPPVPMAHTTLLRPSLCASSVMSTSTWNEVAPSLLYSMKDSMFRRAPSQLISGSDRSFFSIHLHTRT